MNWIIQNSTRSHCGECDGYLDMLVPDNEEGPSEANPWFWICWPCKRIWLVGCDGEVRREEVTK